MRFVLPVKIALAAIACLLVGAGAEFGARPVDALTCERIQERRDILSLSESERTAFFKALRTFQSESRPFTYDTLAKIHDDYNAEVHGTARFLVWHRVFTRVLEYELQRIDPSVTIPYWDWSINSQAPHEHPIFSSTWAGGNGRPEDGCVVDGWFADWRPAYPSPGCLMRKFRGAPGLNPFYPPEVLRYISDESKTYAAFNELLELSPHNVIHYTIGGHMGMSFSPSDPLFFLHHSFVDLLWAQWQ
ncbi:hypothetical protein SYNPS1DRAFT_12780, partial [Syncephalis pseudoplumigaleata]